ncbi:PREDICTED: uncharacterized protein LOC108366665, partial [Rhagoletis zephyria]|uniref:uncharacterized protein LOC108366665 n=1 Tax=Rhagoletis zephyria TaxID=28612 RepID=UPI0008117FA6
VRTLKLTDNWLKIINSGDLDSYPLLQYLDLSHSRIENIEDDALGRLEILETLFLDHNQLAKVPISLPTSLEHLFLQHNEIMDIQPQSFTGLNNLQTLDLSGNKLLYLPALPLPKLLTLNLRAAGLRGVSQAMVHTLPRLRDLLLDENPIKCSDLLSIAEWASPCRIVERSGSNNGDGGLNKTELESFNFEGNSIIDDLGKNEQQQQQQQKGGHNRFGSGKSAGGQLIALSATADKLGQQRTEDVETLVDGEAAEQQLSSEEATKIELKQKFVRMHNFFEKFKSNCGAQKQTADGWWQAENAHTPTPMCATEFEIGSGEPAERTEVVSAGSSVETSEATFNLPNGLQTQSEKSNAKMPTLPNLQQPDRNRENMTGTEAIDEDGGARRETQANGMQVETKLFKFNQKNFTAEMAASPQAETTATTTITPTTPTKLAAEATFDYQANATQAHATTISRINEKVKSARPTGPAFAMAYAKATQAPTQRRTTLAGLERPKTLAMPTNASVVAKTLGQVATVATGSGAATAANLLRQQITETTTVGTKFASAKFTGSAAAKSIAGATKEITTSKQATAPQSMLVSLSLQKQVDSATTAAISSSHNQEQQQEQTTQSHSINAKLAAKSSLNNTREISAYQQRAVGAQAMLPGIAATTTGGAANTTTNADAATSAAAAAAAATHASTAVTIQQLPHTISPLHTTDSNYYMTATTTTTSPTMQSKISTKILPMAASFLQIKRAQVMPSAQMTARTTTATFNVEATMLTTLAQLSASAEQAGQTTQAPTQRRTTLAGLERPKTLAMPTNASVVAKTLRQVATVATGSGAATAANLLRQQITETTTVGTKFASAKFTGSAAAKSIAGATKEITTSKQATAPQSMLVSLSLQKQVDSATTAAISSSHNQEQQQEQTTQSHSINAKLAAKSSLNNTREISAYQQRAVGAQAMLPGIAATTTGGAANTTTNADAATSAAAAAAAATHASTAPTMQSKISTKILPMAASFLQIKRAQVMPSAQMTARTTTATFNVEATMLTTLAQLSASAEQAGQSGKGEDGSEVSKATAVIETTKVQTSTTPTTTRATDEKQTTQLSQTTIQPESMAKQKVDNNLTRNDSDNDGYKVQSDKQWQEEEDAKRGTATMAAKQLARAKAAQFWQQHNFKRANPYPNDISGQWRHSEEERRWQEAQNESTTEHRVATTRGPVTTTSPPSPHKHEPLQLHIRDRHLIGTPLLMHRGENMLVEAAEALRQTTVTAKAASTTATHITTTTSTVQSSKATNDSVLQQRTMNDKALATSQLMEAEHQANVNLSREEETKANLLQLITRTANSNNFSNTERSQAEAINVETNVTPVQEIGSEDQQRPVKQYDRHADKQMLAEKVVATKTTVMGAITTAATATTTDNINMEQHKVTASGAHKVYATERRVLPKKYDDIAGAGVGGRHNKPTLIMKKMTIQTKHTHHTQAPLQQHYSLNTPRENESVLRERSGEAVAGGVHGFVGKLMNAESDLFEDNSAHNWNSINEQTELSHNMPQPPKAASTTATHITTTTSTVQSSKATNDSVLQQRTMNDKALATSQLMEAEHQANVNLSREEETKANLLQLITRTANSNNFSNTERSQAEAINVETNVTPVQEIGSEDQQRPVKQYDRHADKQMLAEKVVATKTTVMGAITTAATATTTDNINMEQHKVTASGAHKVYATERRVLPKKYDDIAGAGVGGRHNKPTLIMKKMTIQTKHTHHTQAPLQQHYSLNTPRENESVLRERSGEAVAGGVHGFVGKLMNAESDLFEDNSAHNWNSINEQTELSHNMPQQKHSTVNTPVIRDSRLGLLAAMQSVQFGEQSAAQEKLDAPTAQLSISMQSRTPTQSQLHEPMHGQERAAAHMQTQKWLDARKIGTGTAHPGVVILLSFSLLAVLLVGLMHVYRCDVLPWRRHLLAHQQRPHHQRQFNATADDDVHSFLHYHNNGGGEQQQQQCTQQPPRWHHGTRSRAPYSSPLHNLHVRELQKTSAVELEVAARVTRSYYDVRPYARSTTAPRRNDSTGSSASGGSGEASRNSSSSLSSTHSSSTAGILEAADDAFYVEMAAECGQMTGCSSVNDSQHCDMLPMELLAMTSAGKRNNGNDADAAVHETASLRLGGTDVEEKITGAVIGAKAGKQVTKARDNSGISALQANGCRSKVRSNTASYVAPSSSTRKFDLW